MSRQLIAFCIVVDRFRLKPGDIDDISKAVSTAAQLGVQEIHELKTKTEVVNRSKRYECWFALLFTRLISVDRVLADPSCKKLGFWLDKELQTLGLAEISGKTATFPSILSLLRRLQCKAEGTSEMLEQELLKLLTSK